MALFLESHSGQKGPDRRSTVTSLGRQLPVQTPGAWPFVLPTVAQLPGLWGVMQRRPGPVPPGLTGRAMTVLTGRSPSRVLREPGLMDKEIDPPLPVAFSSWAICLSDIRVSLPLPR